MKKVIIILRDGFDANFICTRISEIQKKYEIIIIYESGKYARKKKINRMLKNGKNIFLTLVNMATLVVYDKSMLHAMNKVEKTEKRTLDFSTYKVDDINEQKCIQLCNSLNPDLILIYGTGILSGRTIRQLDVDIYNIHSSVLPYYRNVHSDFWAYVNKDYDKIGISIFKIDEGIDTGKIAKQTVSYLPRNSKLSEYKVENLKNIVKMIPMFLNEYFSGDIELQEQNRNEGSLSNTPTTSDILRFVRTEIRKKDIL